MQGGFRISAERRRRGAGDTFVPMINIVFLLLIFFLLSATIAPPDPFDVSLPEASVAEAEEAGTPDTLHVAADGALRFGMARGEAALAAIAQRTQGEILILRADAQLDGAAFSALLSRLAGSGVTALKLSVRQP